MSRLVRLMKQTATYWSPVVKSTRGVITFGSPTTLNCRWEEKSEQFLNAQNEQEVSKSVVYLDTDVLVGGYLFLGKSTAANPQDVAGARPIKAVGKVTSVRRPTVALRKAML